VCLVLFVLMLSPSIAAVDASSKIMDCMAVW